MSLVRLNAFSDFLFLFLSLSSSLILGQNYLNKILFYASVNFGSIYCFVDLKLICTYKLKTSLILLVKLCLFNSLLNSTISKIVAIFFFNKYMNLDFYITLVDFFYSFVLEYNQFTQYNSLIDWINRLITFCPFLQKNQVSLYIAVKHGLYFEMKVHKIIQRFVSRARSYEIYKQSQFSLYAVLSAYCRVTTSEK